MHRSKPRFVLFLQGSTSLGGSKRSLLDTIKALDETEYQAVVACPQKGWLTDELDKLETPYVLLPFYAWRKWLERPRVLPSIRQHWLPVLEGQGFDLIHSNEFWWAPHAVELARLLKIPAIVHLRDGHHTLKKAHQYRLVEADAVLAVSTELRDQFVVDPQLHNKTRILFNGHQEMSFDGSQEKARKIFNLTPEEFVIGNVGKISERKNQRLLLRAMAHLKKQRRTTPFKLLFAGDAEPNYAKLVVKDVEQLELRSEAQFLGQIENMEAFYSAIDLLAHCALREGLPRVVPEAMLVRRSVVATAAQGIRDAIPNEQFGSVVPADDEAGLKNEIERLLTNPPLRKSIADQAYRRACSLFSFEAYRKKLLAIYGSLPVERTT